MDKQFRNLSKKLLAWYDRHGRHHLPWKQNPSAYHIWISEIMLQQTQVATVIPYYFRFLQCFPTLKTLAASPLDSVLKHWAGLGYYARARNLHKTAQIIAKDYKGKFPASVELLETLPGIGRSTAGAIASLAFGTPSPIMDANVKRVFARYFGIRESLKDKKIMELLWEYADKSVSKKRPGDYNQALMDLGASICSAKNPQCLVCPLNQECVACKTQMQNTIPFSANKTKIKKLIKENQVLIIQFQNKILLEKRPNFGIWGGLWSLPECALEEDAASWCKLFLGMRATALKKMQPIKHVFTHYTAIFHPVVLEIKKLPLQCKEMENKMWYTLQTELAGGLPAPIQKLLNKMKGTPSVSDGP